MMPDKEPIMDELKPFDAELQKWMSPDNNLERMFSASLTPTLIPQTPALPDNLPDRQVRRADGLTEPEAETFRANSLERLRRLLSTPDAEFYRGGLAAVNRRK
jgi:hypothetical protein